MENDNTNQSAEETVEEQTESQESQADNLPKSQDELDKIINARVSRAEKKARLEGEQKALEQAKEEQDQAKKLAKMSDAQKYEAQLEELKKQNQELLDKTNRSDIEKEASKLLAEKGLTADDELLNIVVKKDASETAEAIDTFVELVSKKADELRKTELKGKVPKAGSNSSVPGISTLDELMGLSATDQQEFKTKYPEQYAKINK